jgi:triphosphatase
MTTRLDSKSTRTKEPSATDHQEIEWQFDADELESVDDWLDQHDSGSSGLVVVPESTLEITDTYYDTDDWRFYRAGYALRVRSTDGEVEATMKSLTPAEGSLMRRREISEPLSDDKLATLREAGGPVGGRSRTLVSGRELRPLFTLETRRQRFALLLESSTDSSQEDVRIGEISLDTSEIPLGEEKASLTRVEVGAGMAPTPDLKKFEKVMESQSGANIPNEGTR